MIRLHFTVTLLEDVIFSERSATAGAHATLDHLPGSALLGYCAGRLYNDLGDQAFAAFHSGQVRFGSAYPLTPADEPTLPIPLCWHLEKGKNLREHGREIVSLIYIKDEEFAAWEKQGVQQKQLRTGFFSAAGGYVTPERRFRLKTAIDRSRLGRAEEGQLFGYESLCAGSRWYCRIDVDEELPEVAKMIGETLTAQPFRIGHSRTAEYGLVRVEAREETPAFAEGVGDSDLMLVYAVSDLALRDPESGVPTLVPHALHFNLPEGVGFVAEKSCLRTRAYAPFNGTRRTFDLERQVIARGSVLAFRKEAGTFTPEEIAACREKVAAGIGLYRHDGLGRVLVQPAFLAPSFSPCLTPADEKPSGQPAARRESSLQVWLRGQAAQREEDRGAVVQVEEWLKMLVTREALENIPRNAQWGQLRNIALRVRDMGSLRHELFHCHPERPKESKGFCYHGTSEKQWKKTFRFEGRRISYRDFLKDYVIGDKSDDREFPATRRRLYLLANRLPRRVNQLQQEG